MRIEMGGGNYKKIVKACKEAVNKKQDRPTLTYACLDFEDGKATATALDGHVMIQIPVPANCDSCGRVLLDVNAAVKPSDMERVVITADDDDPREVTVLCSSTLSSVKYTTPDPKDYIQHSKVWPTAEPCAKIVFDTDVMMKIVKAFKAAGEKYMRFEIASPLTSAVVHNNDKTIGLILPVRSNEIVRPEHYDK